MRFHLRPLGWRDARAVATWHYDGPYAIYNLDTFEMLTAMLAQQVLNWLGAPYFYAVLDEESALVGMFQLARHGDTVEIGLAMRPDLTGKGLGLSFVQAGLDFGTERYAPAAFQLDVATFNQRAMRVYERAGFRRVRSFTKYFGGRPYEAVEMIRDSSAARGPT
jgi:[ribosomal protein S18]-alanine N-acetyltransferase